MQSPLRITFRDIPPSNAVETYVRSRASKLDRFCPRITGCHVVIETPHRHKRHGHHYRVLIDISVPGEELVIGRDPAAKKTNEDVYAAVDAAFDGAQRVLADHVERQRGDVRAARPEWRVMT